MRHNLLNRAALIAMLAAIFLSSNGWGKSVRPVSFVIHVQSTFSDNGVLTVDEIAQTARENRIDAVILNDHDLEKLEYGIRPLERIVKRSVARTSVLARGPDAFLKEVSAVGEKYPDVVLIPGVESAPFYFWTGSPFTKNLTLTGWHKHLLVAGLTRADDYRHLPVVGNEKNAGKIDPFMLWPAALILAGLLIMKRSRPWGAVTLLAGALFAVNNYPFRRLPYDQYHGDRQELPYQSVIDHVSRTAPDTGLVFWAHPEAPNFSEAQQLGPVKIITPEYPQSLLRTAGYTGFGYFQEGDRKVGSPGGIWDTILTEYVQQKRKNAVWAVSELDYRKEGHDNTYMRSFKNVILTDQAGPLTASSIIHAIKTGRFYALAQPYEAAEIRLDSVRLSRGERSATLGESLAGPGTATLSIALSASDRQEHALTIRIISNGTVSHTVQARTPASITLDLPELTPRSYCRLEIEADNRARIVTNPIFVE